MSVADLLAEHGSPLWLANLDVVRDRQRAFTAAWRAEWPDVEIAYSHKANRLPAILRALAEKGIGHQVACEAEYCLARSVADAGGRSIVVQGPAKPPALLDRAASDGALVIADTLAELRRRRLPARPAGVVLRSRRDRRDRRGGLRGPRPGRARPGARGRRRRPGGHGDRRQAPARPPALHRPRRGDEPAAGDALRMADA